MADLPSGTTSNLPIWCIKLCKWLWKKQKFVWSTFILSIVLNVFASLLLVKWPWVTNTSLDGTFVKWAFQNSNFLLMIGIILLLLLLLIYLGSRFETDKVVSIGKVDDVISDLNEEVSRYYLERMIRSNEILTLKGIPAGLIDKGAQLDEVFISLQFRPNRPLVEYPVTEKERKNLRKYLEGGLFHEEIERILFEAEKSWYYHDRQNERITLIDLWKRLTVKCPAVVIQGFPGMGKSTLMARLTVHMARCSLDLPDPTMPYQLEPKLIPIFLSLGRYAIELAEAQKCNQSLSLASYLELTLQDLNISDLIPFIQTSLANGTCLILLDGLDEVSDQQTRKEVQEAIRNFILEQSSSTDGMNNYNRFLITSRVAGYDQNAFPAYEHFTIAELTSEQVKDFIPRWCRANARRDYGSTISSLSEKDETVAKEVELMESKLIQVVSHHKGVKELAENPLLLTLLAVMQRNSIELPRERVELYKAVTYTLLENRNIAKSLPTIPEAQAIQRLGPIAFQMQETANSFIRRSDVLASLKQTILLEEGGTIEQVTQEAERFLSRIRERSGIFVLRTGDYFGFFHRTFQEYFAARYVLNQIKNNADYWISEFAQKASRQDELWREPFLLAVAYKSSDDEVTARQLINTLLNFSAEGDIESRCHDLLLAVDCLIEARPLTLGSQLEQQVAIKLLQFYEEALRCQDEKACDRVEYAIWHWLTSLPKESYRPAVVVVLYNALSDMQNVARQRAIFVLLAKIISISPTGMKTYLPPVFFNTLIPLLLAIADLPAVGDYLPVPNLLPSPNQSTAALDLFILSLMKKQGPNGSLLAYVHQYFESNPESLRLLAHFSLENHTLLMPVLVPHIEKNYQSYESILKKWIVLCENCHKTQYIEQFIAQCVDIYHTLLVIAEEIRYPIMIDLMNLLHFGEKYPNQPLKDLWQAYFLDQLVNVPYIRYQEIVILWSILFPESPDMEKLFFLVEEQMSNNDSAVRRRAQSFLAMLSYFRMDLQREQKLLALDLKEKQSAKPISGLNILDKLNFIIFQNKKEIESIKSEKTITIQLNLDEFILIKDVMERSIIKAMQHIQDFRVINAMQTIIDLIILRGFRDKLVEEELSHLAKLFLTHEMTEKALYHLSSNVSSSTTDSVDLLLILLGRILQIHEANERGDTITQELQRLAWAACSGLNPQKKEETEIRLDIVRSLPTRSANEIMLVIRLAEEDTHEKIHQACAQALRDAIPQTSEDWRALEVAAQSSLTIISTAAEECLKQKK